MTAPYRSTEIRPESTPLRRSWWDLAMSVLLAGFTGGLAYCLFRYVAAGWIGYGIAGIVALAALLFAREIGTAKVGPCPRCATAVEVGISREGYLCPSCATFLDTDRGQLIVTPSSRVAKTCRFGVTYDRELVLPEVCCVCTAATTRRLPAMLGRAKLDVPYCAEHAHGIVGKPGTVYFRSFEYARRVCEASHGKLAGKNATAKRHDDMRWLGFGLGLLMAGGAAAAYWGLAAMDRAGYELVAASPKGLVLWLCLKLFGRLWVTAILATLAAGFFGMFLGSFKPRRAPGRR